MKNSPTWHNTRRSQSHRNTLSTERTNFTLPILGLNTHTPAAAAFYTFSLPGRLRPRTRISDCAIVRHCSSLLASVQASPQQMFTDRRLVWLREPSALDNNFRPFYFFVCVPDILFGCLLVFTSRAYSQSVRELIPVSLRGVCLGWMVGRR